MGLPWCFGGDFNVTRFPSEARERRFTPAMGSFLISFLNRAWWIYHYWEEGSLCLVIRKLLPCSDLICS